MLKRLHVLVLGGLLAAAALSDTFFSQILLTAPVFGLVAFLVGVLVLPTVLVAWSVTVGLMLSLAVLTALGTLTTTIFLPATALYLTVVGFVVAGQVLILKRRHLWARSWRSVGMLCAHGGFLLLMLGVFLQSQVLNEGVLPLKVGDTRTTFMSVTHQRFDPLPAPFTLKELKVTDHTPKVHLRLFKGDELVQSWPVTPQLEGRLPAAAGGEVFKVVGYYPDLKKEALVSAAPKGPSTKAVVNVQVSTTTYAYADWLFAKRTEDGVLRDRNGRVWVRLTYDPHLAKDEVLVLDATTGYGFWDGTWHKPADFTRTVDSVTVSTRQFMPHATVSYSLSSASDTPRLPFVMLNVGEGDARRVLTLSPLLANGQPLNEAFTLTLYREAVTPAQFTSVLQVDDTERTLSVNDPLRLGICTFYQADFDRADPTYSGFKVTCNPALPFIKLALLLIAAGVGAAILRRQV